MLQSRQIPSAVSISIFVLAIISFPTAPLVASQADLVAVHQSSSALHFEPLAAHDGLVLTVSDPNNRVERLEANSGETISFHLAGRDDGLYRWELRLAPVLDNSTRRELAAGRRSEDTAAISRLEMEGKLPARPRLTSGSFTLAGGSLVQQGQESEVTSVTEEQSTPHLDSSGALALDHGAAPDEVILDDLIVDGSACVGLNCANGESFGFDTIRLKESNLRLNFLDTSTGTFPSADWTLVANDTTNGGSNHFSLYEASAGKTPFTIEAGAGNHALYVGDSGDLGVGTSIPEVEVHVVDGDSSVLRLEQDGSSGFGSQIWDIGGNESNFYVRDSTEGNMPLRIRTDAPQNSILVTNNGSIGLGASLPGAPLHLYRSGGDAQLWVQETSSTEASRTLMQLTNNGRVRWQMTDTSANGQQWTFFSSEDNFNISSGSTAGQEFVLNGNGNLTITGMLFDSSDRNRKENFEEIDKDEILERLAALPITRWNYKEQEDSIQHIGPVAQDFYAAFGLGYDDLHIAPADKASVALASIQALYARLDQKDLRIQALEKINFEMQQRLEAIETRLQAP
ncbi:MAG: tail fiber domain-containing protein [Deltaproteobacteria bacterium]|nr:tail fiber domain-containing protein [Deltaproteobacteria bacterium]